MKDEDLMTFGKHKGEKMANVPASWLVWFYDENIKKPAFKVGVAGLNVLKYIQDTGLDYLRKEAKNVG